MPDISVARVGARDIAASKSVGGIPSTASTSRFGIGVALPKKLGSEYPRSSAKMNKIFGHVVGSGAEGAPTRRTLGAMLRVSTPHNSQIDPTKPAPHRRVLRCRHTLHLTPTSLDVT